MAYKSIIKAYLKDLQRQYSSAISSGQYTAELSYRVPLDEMLKKLAKEFAPEENIDVILEPSKQGTVGRPDWRIHNKDTMGIYGYIEGKGLSEDTFDIEPYKKQINKYLSLGHKVVISDGIEFIFCLNEDLEPVRVSLINKGKMHTHDWSLQKVDPQFEVYMREFFKNPSPQQLNEAKLVELVAYRTRMLADDILEFTNYPAEEAMTEEERDTILLLQKIKDLVYSHNDAQMRTNQVFADFTAQVIMFSLLYAHRVLCRPDDTPIEKEKKIYAYIAKDLTKGESLFPFRDLMLYLHKNDSESPFISRRIDECVKFLSFVKMTEEQLSNPDYHQLFELFLSKFDAKSRFDYGAYYTPKVLADFVVKLTNHVVERNFPGKSIYDDANTIVDPCCGTGSFMEEIISHDPDDGQYNLCGIEILPAPYMLANYRMAIVGEQYGKKNNNVRILLANTLCDSVFNGEADKNTIEGHELLEANKISSLPLMLIIGNPPCSDTLRENSSNDFSIINKLMEDFRPPVEKRRGRQNTQKQINNPFMQFLRWSCEKLVNSENHSVLALVVPLSFLEAESYKYARKYLCKQFSDLWTVAIDADARTGARSDSLFYTLQGRAVIILAREYGNTSHIKTFHFCDYSHNMRNDKEHQLSENIDQIIQNFNEYTLDADTLSFAPTKPFNKKMYDQFWPVDDENGRPAIFLKHCSGIKLAPTSLFTHVKKAMLKRRSREISFGDFDNVKEWFSSQNRPPREKKIRAFHEALVDCGDKQTMNDTLEDNIHPYSFRPYLTSNVLLWTKVLAKYSKIDGGGTRPRPEIIRAYSDKGTIGFAMAHAPKDLNPTLTQFVSFCWYYPDNDMCTRGNSHIYMNRFPEKKTGELKGNIAPQLLNIISNKIEKEENDAANEIVFYTYAVLCSQVFLDEFEGALFTVNQSDKRARIPIVADKELFLTISDLGRKLAELEKLDYQPDNILDFDYESTINEVPSGFHLKNTPHPFDEENELLVLTDGECQIKIKCPLSLQRLNISGYDVVKSVWLKFNSYEFTHCEFTKEDMRRLLNFLNTIAIHEMIVEKIDDTVAPVLHNEVPLVEYVETWHKNG